MNSSSYKWQVNNMTNLVIVIAFGIHFDICIVKSWYINCIVFASLVSWLLSFQHFIAFGDIEYKSTSNFLTFVPCSHFFNIQNPRKNSMRGECLQKLLCKRTPKQNVRVWSSSRVQLLCLLFPKLGTKPRRWAVQERLAYGDRGFLNSYSWSV